MKENYFPANLILLFTMGLSIVSCTDSTSVSSEGNVSSMPPQYQERILLDKDWRFMKYSSAKSADNLIYDERPEVLDDEDGKAADAMPTEAVDIVAKQPVLKPWILPTANKFIKNPASRHTLPAGNSPGRDFPFVQKDFNDASWQQVRVPHDWAIEGPFYKGNNAEVGGGMGRLPSPGVAWYRKSLSFSQQDIGKSIFLDVDGAMSYAMVWINGHLVGGWPYGYASWRVDLTPYITLTGKNQLAIRVDNPPASSRWYPGGGLYRNVWLTKTNAVHVAQWGTYITTPDASKASAKVNLKVTIDNDSDKNISINTSTDIYALDSKGRKLKGVVASIESKEILLNARASGVTEGSVTIQNPRLWGPMPNQTPNRYVAVTTLKQGENLVDQYETNFGIRHVRFDANKGIFVNGEHVYVQGVNQHHDLGALGAAFNVRAAERQLELLRELGANTIRLAHNPPASELLELMDKMGFLVIDEIFDSWERKKTPLDFHLIFPEWSEPDMRSFIRRDRNHPSIILWSLGNEVGEQYTGEAGAKVATRLHNIAKEEDPTRATAISMNYAKPEMPISAAMDAINLNYQGEGIRNAPAYAHLKGINTPPLYPAFHEQFPDKLILSSENAAAVSSRGEYFFPVAKGRSVPVSDGVGGNPETAHVSSYELYTTPFGSSADKVFGSLEAHPFVAGGIVWSGWDYLGEPTPYYSARSSYFGVIDLAGFKKDRFYLYQAHWRPEFPMAHILPHWNWPERVGKVTPVHVFTSGDEAELFLNGTSLGRKVKGQYEYRLRWDDVVYAQGELKVVAYKNGALWAQDSVATTGKAFKITATPDRSVIQSDGLDLSFVTVEVVDENGLVVPKANQNLTFSVEGPGEIVATDNGDPTSLVSFKSLKKQAFNGLCLAIVRYKPGSSGEIKLTVTADGLQSVTVVITRSNLSVK